MGLGYKIASGVLLAIAILAALTIFVPKATTVLGFALLITLVASITALSPTRTITGSTRPFMDVALSVGMLFLAAPDVNTLVGPLSELTATFILAPIGIAILALLSVWTVRYPISQHGALWALRQRDNNKPLRWLLIFALTLILTAGIVQPLSRAVVALHTAPLLLTAIAVTLLVPLRVGVRFDHHRLAQGDTILLGASGLLLMRYALESLIPGLRSFGILSWNANAIVVLATILSIAGLIVIVLAPLFIWRSLLRLRNTADPQHLPDWSPWVVAATTGAVLVALLFPLMSFSIALNGSGWSLTGPSALATLSANIATRALIVGLVGALLVGIVASVYDHARRLFIAVPLLAGLVSLGIFAYHAFVSSFLWSASAILYAITSSSYAAILSASALFWANAILAITGFIAFLYEIWRD